MASYGIKVFDKRSFSFVAANAQRSTHRHRYSKATLKTVLRSHWTRLLARLGPVVLRLGRYAIYAGGAYAFVSFVMKLVALVRGTKPQQQQQQKEGTLKYDSALRGRPMVPSKAQYKPESVSHGIQALIVHLVNLRWIHWLLPASLTSVIHTLAQPYLHARALHVLTRLPPTGLFGPAPDLSQFVRYCTYLIRDTHYDSPRSTLMRQLNATLVDITLAKTAQVQDLYTRLSLDAKALNSTPNLMQVALAYKALTPGKAHLKWQRMVAKSQQEPFTPTVLATALRTKQLRNNMTLEEAQASVDAMVRTKKETQVTEKKMAEEMFSKLEDDAAYLNYTAVQGLWRETGVQQLSDAYDELDRSIGEDRMARGEKFEQNRARVVFLQVKKRLQARYPELRNYTEWDFYIGALWQQKSSGKSIGEIDVTITVRDPITGRVVVVALVEMKANVYELASAFTQHEAKAKAYKELVIIAPGAGGNTQWLASSTSESSTDTASKTILELRFEPPVFVVSLIPEHEYKSGTTPDIQQELSNLFYATSAESFIADVLTDDKAALAIMKDIRNKFDCSQPVEDLLLARRDDIVVLLAP